MAEALLCQLARGIESDDAHGFARFCVEKSRGEFAEVAVLERSLAEAAARHSIDRIRRTAIYLDKDDQPLTRLRFFNPDRTAAAHRHSHAEHLPRTHMPVVAFGFDQ